MATDAQINAWIESNWPKMTNNAICRHCQQPGDDLIPVGYGGGRPRIWLHYECYEPWRMALRAKAAEALDANPRP
jgi:hypothetical protein